MVSLHDGENWLTKDVFWRRNTIRYCILRKSRKVLEKHSRRYFIVLVLDDSPPTARVATHRTQLPALRVEKVRTGLGLGEPTDRHTETAISEHGGLVYIVIAITETGHRGKLIVR